MAAKLVELLLLLQRAEISSGASLIMTNQITVQYKTLSPNFWLAEQGHLGKSPRVSRVLLNDRSSTGCPKRPRSTSGIDEIIHCNKGQLMRAHKAGNCLYGGKSGARRSYHFFRAMTCPHTRWVASLDSVKKIKSHAQEWSARVWYFGSATLRSKGYASIKTSIKYK